MTIITKIPKELKQLLQWCVVKIEMPNHKGQHKRKIPINPTTGNGASSSDPSTSHPDYIEKNVNTMA
ncbi:hypothetical protein [Lactobacillus johnsonii]|uniref:hypothetical protein n=1 Tax=Lactobacillus johnsonii TaxID=33959 RepID=UPI001FB26368|nr:hypothetical protein [Lactobacillus johnsonii]UOC05714.1 hypothetical protein LC811_07770 [Lactobacillus johnsonii]